jgi:hypothetical protein
MSIRILAKELYKISRRLEELEKELVSLEVKDMERRQLEEELRGVRAEFAYLRAMLDGAKDGP